MRSVRSAAVEVIADRILEHLDELAAGQLQLEENVGVGENRVGGTEGDIALGQGGADAAAVLQGDVGEFAGLAVGFRNGLGNVAAAGQRVGFLAAGDTAAAVGRFAGDANETKRLAGDTDLLPLHVIEAAGVAREFSLGNRVRRNDTGAGAAELAENPRPLCRVHRNEGAAAILLTEVIANRQRYLPAAASHRPPVVEAHMQQAEELGILPRLGDADRIAVAVAGHGGIRTRGRGDADGREIAEQRMRIATDDRVDVGQPGGHRQVSVVALMGNQDDVTDAPGAQGVDGLLGGIDLVEEAGAGQRP